MTWHDRFRFWQIPLNGIVLALSISFAPAWVVALNLFALLLNSTVAWIQFSE